MTRTGKYKKRKISYFSAFISISLVLFLIGLFGLLVYHGNQLKDYLKENVEVSILFMDDVNEADIIRFKTALEDRKDIKSINYVSAEDAKEMMVRDLGEDIPGILGYNPFPPSLDIRFQANYTAVDSIEQFKREYAQNRQIKEIYYQKALVGNIERNMKIAAAVVLILAVIFLLIAFTLINNTIRLTLYSKRFLIKTMQLIGARPWFIRKPFIGKSVLTGVLGSLFASTLLMLLLYFIESNYPFIKIYRDAEVYAALIIGLMLLGLLISFFSSLFSVNRYLRMKLDDLY